MSTESASNLTSNEPAIVVPTSRRASIELQNGDRMTQQEFHRLYEQTPEGFKAELIGGIVYVASPLYPAHGKPHMLLSVRGCGV